MAGVSSSLRQQATAVVNQQLLSLFRWQKLCQLLLSISQVSLISQHLILHLSVEQSRCKNKSFVAKEHLGCTIAIYFPIQNATSFPEMKHVMWPAAGAHKVQDHAKERKRRVQISALCWLAQVVALWLPGLRAVGQELSSCTHPMFYWSPAWHQNKSWSLGSLKEPNRSHLSSQHTERDMAHFCDILVTTQSCKDDRCHPNHYRAVFQWLQTQSKAKRHPVLCV